MKKILILLFLAIGLIARSQVAINTSGSLPDNSAMLDVKSTNKGILIPRMTAAEMQAIATPAAGLMVYNTTGQAFYSYNGTAWVMLVAGSAAMVRDADGNTRVEVEKYPNEDIIRYSLGGVEKMVLKNNRLEFNNNGYNVFIGDAAGQANLFGTYNVAIGNEAMNFNTRGSLNIAIGYQSLNSQSFNPGYYWPTENVAIGTYALRSNEPTAPENGKYNNAVGSNTLYHNYTGYNNSALGHKSLYYNTTGSNNTAVGYHSLYGHFSNGTGYQNTACGASALQTITGGLNNCALGYLALSSNTNGSDNTGSGSAALFNNENGNYNTANGREALRDNITNYNTAVGYHASQTTNTGFMNSSLGANSLVNNTTGSYNTAIGFNTGPNTTNLSNTTCIGTDATSTASDMVRIGNGFVNSIGGQVGWTTLSDGRFKENVMEDVPGLAFITQLRPVSYQVNRESVNDFTGLNARKQEQSNENIDMTSAYTTEPISPVTTGFIAQEVEAAAKNIGFDFSGIDAPDNENDMYGLRYAEFVVPLVKAVQELNLKMENEEMKKQIAELLKRIEKLEQINL